MRVLYLFTGVRGGLVEKTRRGEDTGDGTWGMLRLPHFGLDARHLELEQFIPGGAARWLRVRIFGVYGAHLPFLFNFFRYDIVFTAGAFVSQLVLTVLQGIFRFRHPLWVMHDFSITGLLGEEKTLKQKIFRFMTARAGGIVTVGKEEAQKLKERFPSLADRIVYIPFGVDTAFFRPGDIKETGAVLAAGVDPDRDWETLFAACDGLGIQVVAATRPRGRTVAPPPFVRMSFFTMKQLREEYSRASIVVVPLDTTTGINDAMGSTALFEALAMGKAVVATDTHTMRSHITHGENGLLVPERDVAAMRAAIKELSADQAKRERLGRAARAYAVANLDAEKLTGELAAYFKNLLR